MGEISERFSLNKQLLFSLGFIFMLVFSLTFVSAQWIDCWQYSPYQSGGSASACDSAGCVVTSATGSVSGFDGTVVTDYFCGSDMPYCCLNKECWQWEGTSQEACEANDGTLNCTWDTYYSTMWLPNGSAYTLNGSCMTDWNVLGEDSWGGVSSGCWQYDADKQQCLSNYQECEWKPNEANQNPWCWIKNLFDAQTQNSLATFADIGCCDMKGCWSYDGNESLCVNNTAFSGACTWSSKADDPWCPDETGCCYTKWCSEAGDNETICDNLKQQLMMPCDFVDGSCQEYGGAGGGFSFYDNNTDSCMQNGGWYDMSGNCTMPNMTMTGGPFMFGGEAHCYFADNQPAVCGNITGCAYCNDTAGPNGISNSSDNNICFGKQIGYCEGHDIWMPTNYVNANNSANLNCTHIQVKSACKYGPLPNCKWTNSTNMTGAYCEVGKSNEVKAAPPVPFCEHVDSKNNQSLCNNLSTNYLMPCKWYTNYTTVSGMLVINCSFNPSAVFGSDVNAEKDYLTINNDLSCIASGGTWQTEYYLDGDVLKQDSWCEKGALFDTTSWTAAGNKGNCNTDCWACEFRVNGSRWDNQSFAETQCLNSSLGYCRWINDTYAPNGQGYCDYPDQMNYGAGDCQVNCKDCDLMSNAYVSCIGSQANCKWMNNTDLSGSFLSTGFCVSQSKKLCANDCFSCYGESDCFASTINCMWDSTNKVCTPTNFDGEVCFDGIDNDNDGFKDCSDPDCSYDNSCGGNNFANCPSYTSNETCTVAVAFGNMNCTWYNFTWEIEGHCGMPGEDCWTYDGNATACGLANGCTNESTFFAGNTNGFCGINNTKMDSAQCWTYSAYADCNAQLNCGWTNDSWCLKNPDDSWCQDYGGWCDYKIFADCHNLNNNSNSCNANTNCTWHQDEWMGEGEGFCDVACFNWSLDSTTCVDGSMGAICQWTDYSATESSMCMPSTFDVMVGGSGGKVGCAQYDGDSVNCSVKNYTCVWVNDSYINNNVSVDSADGWCMDKGVNNIMGDMKGDMIFLGMDEGNTNGGAESGVVGWADIKGFGVRATDKSYGFGVGIYNLTNASVCNGYTMRFSDINVDNVVGVGYNITKMRWYLDTDGSSNVQRHCSAVNSNGNSCDANNLTLCDYEFYIDYIVRNNTNTGSIETTKKLYACVQNDSTTYQWAPTNVFVTDDKKFTCWDSMNGAVFVSIEKESFENFEFFNITEPIKIFAVSYDGYNSTAMADEIGPRYYTPGTVDFGFVDCSDPNTKDLKCKNFQKFGIQVFEDCKNGYDDDSDGNSDCDDSECIFTPACASGTAFDWDSLCSGDYKAPIVMFTNIDKMADAAIIQYDTDDASNGSLLFYHNDSFCTTINTTIDDLGDTNVEFDDYKPFHKALLDLDTTGSLINNTIYYYKLRVCDPCGNCGTSKCMNFTTKKQNKPFIFRMDLPAGYTVNITNSTGGQIYAGNFTTAIGNSTYDIGVKVNSSQTKNMNISVHYEDLSIKFIGADLYKPKVLNLEHAFTADTTNEVLGMNSSAKAWNYLISDLGMGGAGDSIELSFPIAYSTTNTINWAHDDGTSSSDVTNYVNCTGNTTATDCRVPVSLGFSEYSISVPGSSSPGSGGSGSSPPVQDSIGEDSGEDDAGAGSSDDDAEAKDEGAEAGGIGGAVEKAKEALTGKLAIGLFILLLALLLALVIYFIYRKTKEKKNIGFFSFLNRFYSFS